jgi:hypothetical protein
MGIISGVVAQGGSGITARISPTKLANSRAGAATAQVTVVSSTVRSWQRELEYTLRRAQPSWGSTFNAAPEPVAEGEEHHPAGTCLG